MYKMKGWTMKTKDEGKKLDTSKDKDTERIRSNKNIDIGGF